jgi:hypothetical protein
MTSNLGMEKVELLSKKIGFGIRSSSVNATDIEGVVKNELKLKFKPEFLKRIDEFVIFAPLTHEQLKRVVDLEIRMLKERIAEQSETGKQFVLDIQDSAKDFVLSEAEKDDSGVSEIKHILDTQITDILGNELAKGTIGNGSLIIVTHKSGDTKLTFDVDNLEDLVHTALPAHNSNDVEASERTLMTLLGLKNLSADAMQATLNERSLFSNIDEIKILEYFANWLKLPAVKEMSLASCLELFIEPDAVTFLTQQSVNTYWFWALLHASFERANTVRLTKENINRGRNGLRAKHGLIDHYDYAKNPIMYGKLAVQGLLVLGKDKDGKDCFFTNNIFT